MKFTQIKYFKLEIKEMKKQRGRKVEGKTPFTTNSLRFHIEEAVKSKTDGPALTCISTRLGLR